MRLAYDGGYRMSVEVTCVICERVFLVIPSREKSAKYCCYRCKQVGAGRAGGRVTGELKKLSSEGKAYTKTKGRHTHRVVMEQHIGRPLKSTEIVHHKDGNILNNNIENLELLNSQGDHVRSHIYEMLKKRKEKHGY